MKKNKYYIFLGILLSFVCFIIFYFVRPVIAGDGITYRDSMQFLMTGVKTLDFTPNRLLTTFGGLEVIIFLTKIFGSMVFSWALLNIIFYFLFVFIFYKIILFLHKNENVAFISSLLLAFNYGPISFGLNYLLDMGGWFFYILSLYFTFLYCIQKERKYILLASLSVGVGILFKEYAVLGVVPIACILIYENYRSIIGLIRKSFVPTFISLLPFILLSWYIYSKFGYTYADWFSTNITRYEHVNRLAQYIKCFGSLLTLLIPLFLLGLRELWKQKEFVEKRNLVFIVSTVLSFFPLFLWPGITQRVLFVSVPSIIIVSSFFIKKYANHFYLWLLVLSFYALINLTMDSFILSFINLPF